ncbi:hypothetical protein ACX3O0_11880 [Homoserinimonas sp. A447]
MTDSRRDYAVGVQRPSTATMRRFGSMVILVGGVALIGAFIPGVTLTALIVAVLGLALGILCLVLDHSFNVLGLIGTVMSSAAVSLAIIMGLVYGS